ncbi:MAG TPA: Rho-binding antiterminator [Cellvibrio sp.]|nr:Rho-binding antiterminator [Cellvibrio sp.]
MISCDQHDYIEIVCMYHYPIKLTLKSGAVLQGTAVDTQRDEKRVECIKLECEGVERLVVLDEIKLLEACEDNPHVHTVVFE